MPVTCKDIADLARDAATGRRGDVAATLGNDNCWRAVLRLGTLAGAYSDDHYQMLDNMTSNHSFMHLVRPNFDPNIGTALALRNVPPGHVLGFFRKNLTQWTMSHLMVTTGLGIAAGTNNMAVGMVPPLGNPGTAWFMINLAQNLNFNGTGYTHTDGNQVYLVHRPMTDLGVIG